MDADEEVIAPPKNQIGKDKKMKATITYRTGNSIMTMEVENVAKIERVYGTYEGKTREELRVYDTDYHWRTWIADGIINIFIQA